MQPLDVAFFSPLSTYYAEAQEVWLRNHTGMKVTQFQIAQLFNEAYGRAATIRNAERSFQSCGIWPVNELVFTESLGLFAGAETLNPTTTPASSAVPPRTAIPASAAVSPSTEIPATTTVSTPHVQTASTSNSNSAVGSPEEVFLSVLNDVSPLPHVLAVPTSNKDYGFPSNATVLTSTPYKRSLLEKEIAAKELDEKKKQRAAERKEKQKLKAAEKENKAKLRAEKKTGNKKKGAAKRKLFESETETDDEYDAQSENSGGDFVEYSSSDDEDEDAVNLQDVCEGVFVIINEGKGKGGQDIFSAGEVTKIDNNSVTVVYLHPKKSAFLKTDKSFVWDLKQVVKILPSPKTGNTKRSSALFYFHFNFNRFGLCV